MKVKAFKEKVKELCKKAGMKTLIAVCAVVVLAGVVALNFILTGKVKETGKIGIDLSGGSVSSG